jgi:phosphatidylethanolamine-binding protein (PEBP) family uncharacterized protein
MRSATSSRLLRCAISAGRVALLAGLLAAAGCSHDGKTLRPPAPGVTAPPRSTTTTVAPGQFGSDAVPGISLALSSSAFEPGGEIPATYTCAGDGASPPLAWTNIPAGAVEVVITVTDQTAGGQLQWLIAGIMPTNGQLAENAIPTGVESENYEGGVGWASLCPPPGESHTYDLTVWALASPSAITQGMPADQAYDQLIQTDGWRAVLTGTATGR